MSLPVANRNIPSAIGSDHAAPAGPLAGGSNGRRVSVGAPTHDRRWHERIVGRRPTPPTSGVHTVGVLEGEGIGREVIGGALDVLAALEIAFPHRVVIRRAPEPAALAARTEMPLSAGIIEFCESVFADGGAVLAGPVAGRFVYDIRARFDLFCKLSPLRPCPELGAAGRLKAEHMRDIDILVVRENASGVYQGESRVRSTGGGERQVEHTFAYTSAEVRRIVQVAAGLAADRRGSMMVVIKDGGLPALSGLWRESARDAAATAGVDCRFANVDLAAYLLVQHPQDLDIMVAPDLFGDVLADVGGILVGSRGLTYSANFATSGAAVYQTNHGAALDLAGTDRANPAGQIYSLAMLLRESLGLVEAATIVEAALVDVWREGWRTDDLPEAGGRPVGTRELAARVAEAVIERARAHALTKA